MNGVVRGVLLSILLASGGFAKAPAVSEDLKAVERPAPQPEDTLPAKKESIVPEKRAVFSKAGLLKRCQVLRDRVRDKFKLHGIPVERNRILEQIEEQLAYLQEADSVDALALLAAGECKGLETAAAMLVAAEAPKRASMLKPPIRRKQPFVQTDEEYGFPPLPEKRSEDNDLSSEKSPTSTAPLIRSKRYDEIPDDHQH